MFSMSLGLNDEEVDKLAFPRGCLLDIALATLH